MARITVTVPVTVAVVIETECDNITRDELCAQIQVDREHVMRTVAKSLVLSTWSDLRTGYIGEGEREQTTGVTELADVIPHTWEALEIDPE